MGTTRLLAPLPPSKGGKLVDRLRLSNWRQASIIRRHPTLGYIRITIVGTRYYDRGAGGFMAGRGAWVTEGRVVCSSYPEPVDQESRVPAVESVAGWGFSGNAPAATDDGELVEIGDKPASRPKVKHYERKFWTIDEAIAYANGEDGGDIGRDTVAVKVRRLNGRYRLQVDGPAAK